MVEEVRYGMDRNTKLHWPEVIKMKNEDTVYWLGLVSYAVYRIDLAGGHCKIYEIPK